MVKTDTDRTDTASSEPPLSAPLVYGLGLVFVVLLMVCYIKADVMLGWMESIIRALFL